jgi:hypothetical protein
LLNWQQPFRPVTIASPAAIHPARLALRFVDGLVSIQNMKVFCRFPSEVIHLEHPADSAVVKAGWLVCAGMLRRASKTMNLGHRVTTVD